MPPQRIGSCFLVRAQPGMPVANFSTTPYPNTVIANGLTIGNASSNATNLASATTFWLFSNYMGHLFDMHSVQFDRRCHRARINSGSGFRC